ncbi:MAG TPA: hypothetical protein VIC82_06455 [Candidatus Nanopelagicales bacterium]|jgi:hypothetical protein
MNKSMLAILNESERLLVAETDRAELAQLDEDEAIALHARIRKARNKYVGQYRRTASARVVDRGARGEARPKNQRAALKAEAFEEALSRVSQRLGVLSRQAAAELRSDRLAAARGVKAAPPAGTKGTASTASRRTVTDKPRGDRALRSPVSKKQNAGTKASGARRQAKRDSR